MTRDRTALLSPLLFVFALALSGCGGGGADGGEEEQTDPLNITVDAENGDDQNPGTANAPFKSITRALTSVALGGTIHVRKGTYDDANGESFPLRIPANVRLLGDAAPTQRPTIAGTGRAPAAVTDQNELTTIIPGTGSEIANLELLGIASGPADIRSVVMAAFSRVVLRNLRIEGPMLGIYVPEGAAGLLVQGCRVRRALIGLLMAGGHNSLVERNSFRESEYGLFVAHVVNDLDLGGGARSSEGRNVFAGNAIADLFVARGNSVMAQSNFWDHAPDPSEYLGSNPPAGVDIWLRGPQTDVDTTGAMDTSMLPGSTQAPPQGPVTQGP